MIKKLFSIFAGKTTSSPAQPPASASFSDSPVSLDSAAKFVEYIVKSLVDNPGDVKIELKKTEKDQTININCKKEDIGKIIGKNGKTIMAIRTLVSGAASRVNQQVNVEVVDQVAN